MVEVLISVMIGSITLLLVVTLNVSATTNFIHYREKSTAQEESSYLLSNLAKKIQMAGGGPLALSSSIWVEDGNNGNKTCPARGPFGACNGSDRLTLIRYESFSFVDLSVDAMQTSSCLVTKTLSPTSLQIFKDSTNNCCLNATFKNKQAMLILNGSYGQRYIRSMDLGSCQVTIEPGPAAGHDILPGGAPVSWDNASLNVVTVSTYYLDPKTHFLMQYIDPLNTGTLDNTTTQVMADQVYDFQVALGYDINSDGVVADAGSATDEWLYNAPGAAEALGVGNFLNTVPNMLAMVEVGVILGHPDPGVAAGSLPAQILNGPSIPFPSGWNLIGATTKLMPRNSQIFK